MRRHAKIGARVQPWAVTLCLLALAVLWTERNVLAGRSAFFLRDIGTTHRPAWDVFARIGYARTNPCASFGQPYLGNPSLLIAYPFPKIPWLVSIFILLHVALAFVGMIALLRRLEVSLDGAVFGAISFALSGYVLSAASSLNSIATIGWMPWVLWATIRLRDSDGWKIPTAVLTPILAVFSVAGEPVLILLTLILCVILLACARPRRLGAFLCAGLVAGVLLLPVHMQTFEAARDSMRVVEGYSFQRATAASVHPARLLESAVPFLFGNPSRLGPGAFWGYRLNNAAQPYIFSLSLSVVTLLLAGLALQRSADRFWWVIAAVALVISFGNHLPGSELLYDAISPLHTIRFPVKAFLVVTLVLTIIAAREFDRRLARLANPQPRAGALTMILALATLVCAFLAYLARPSIQRALLRWWDPRWSSSPDLVLQPTVEGIPGRLLFVVALLFCTGWALGSRVRWRPLVVQLACLADLMATGSMLMPTVVFALGLVQKIPEADGTNSIVPVNSEYTSSAIQVIPALETSRNLNPGSPVVSLSNNQTTGTSLAFATVHFGQISFTLLPTSMPNTGPLTVMIRVVRPPALAGGHNEWDDRILEAAHERGIPPQVLKGQIRQESPTFLDTEYRYEPCSSDYLHITGAGWIRQAPYSLYAMDSALNNPALSATVDLRNRLSIFDPPGQTVNRRPLNHLDRGITARAIWEANDNDATFQQHWPVRQFWSTYCDARIRFLRTHTADEFLAALEFIAQTPTASSYGVMQVLYETAVDRSIRWSVPDPDIVGGITQSPRYLRDTPESLTLPRGGSIWAGGSKDVYTYRRFYHGRIPSSFASQQDYFDSFIEPLRLYEGGQISDYGTNIINIYRYDYLPLQPFIVFP